MDYRREIDGLRAVAVIPVLLFHAGFRGFSGGFVGVDVFFVVSGYLITTIIFRELEAGTFSIINFYERRARRILPALFVVLFATLPFAWSWLLPGDMEDFSDSLVAVALFASNILFWRETGYFDTAAELKPLLHTWSLAVEEQYYVLFPFFLLMAWKFMRTRMLLLICLVALASLAITQWGSVHQPSATYFLLPTRGWELLIGAYTAIYLARCSQPPPQVISQPASAIGLALIVYAVLVFDEKTPFPSLYALAPTIGTALIILFATRQTWMGRLLGNSVFVGMGLVSYSAYLWHQPLYAMARHRSIDEPGAAIFLSLLLLSVFLAYLSWRYVETPFRNKRVISRQQVFAFGAVCSLCIIAFGLTGHFTQGYLRRFPEDVLAIRQTEKLHVIQRGDDVCNIRKTNFNLAGCIKGDPAVTPRHALLGDSHATALAHELDSAFKARNLSFIQYTKNNCPPAFGFLQIPTENCDKYQSAYMDELAARGIDTIIVNARWSAYISEGDYDNGEGGIERIERSMRTMDGVSFDESFQTRRNAILASYKESIVKLIENGKMVILVYPVPEQGWNIPKAISKSLVFGVATPHHLSVRSEEFSRRNAEVIAALDSVGERANLKRIRPHELLCNTFISGRCASHLDGAPLYYDDDHLSNGGARIVVSRIMEQLGRLGE